MATQIYDLVTAHNDALKGNSAPAYQSKRRNAYAEQAHRTKYRPNPLNYALDNTYKLWILWNDNTVSTFIAPVFITTYNAFAYNRHRPGFDFDAFMKWNYNKAWDDFMNRINVKYYGQYQCACIFKIEKQVSQEIIRYESGIEKPAEFPFDGVLFDSISFNTATLDWAVKTYLK